MIAGIERTEEQQNATVITLLMEKWAMNRQAVVRTLKETSRFHGLSIKEAAARGTQDRFLLKRHSRCGGLAT